MFSRNMILSALACVAFATVGATTAVAAPAKVQTAQQMKMGQCNKDATGKKGDERKAFMKSCLSASSTATAAAKPTQQEKMKTCNADAKAKAMEGDTRKAYMKTCLSDHAAPAA